MILVPLFGTVDFFLYPTQFRALMAARCVSGGVSLGLLLWLRRAGGRHYPTWIGFALMLQCALAIAVIPVYLTGPETPHYVGIALLILSAAAMLPWRPAEIAALSVILAVMFVAGALLHNNHLWQVPGFGAQVSAILISAVLGGFITSLGERMRFRELATRRELKVASREKTYLIRHLEGMATRLSTANEDLEERQRETNDFLYVLSHDLRAPLINIQGFGKRLQTDMHALEDGLDATTPEAAAHRLGRMKQSLQFLNAGTAKIDQLISRLLDVARVATRPGDRVWIDAQTLIEDVLGACRFQLEAAHVEVLVADLPTVWGDPVQLNQVFTNLIDNAVKYMGERPRRQIRITCTSNGDRYRFGVHDTGPGIEPKDREKVFRLFARLAPNGSSGEGVGLATVRAIVNRHGGRIWVESTPGEGSSFYFTLPRQPAKPELAGPSSSTGHREEIAANVH